MKKTIVVVLSLAHASAASGDPVREPPDPDARFAALERREPSLGELRRAALGHAGLRARPEASWSSRARLSGLLPVLTLSFDGGHSSDRDLSRTSSGAQRLDLGSDRDTSFGARAVWHLDRLVYSDSEIRALTTARRLHQERAQIHAQVTSLYFQRRKLQIAAIWTPERDAQKRALRQLAIEELTAQLDFLTGGYLGRALARGHR